MNVFSFSNIFKCLKICYFKPNFTRDDGLVELNLNLLTLIKVWGFFENSFHIFDIWSVFDEILSVHIVLLVWAFSSSQNDKVKDFE